jgi:hypothetical protein
VLDLNARQFEPGGRDATRSAESGRVAWRCARRAARTWLLACSLVCLLAQSLLAQPAGDTVINREYTLKALFLYNFGSYVQWPREALGGDDKPFVIGVLGYSPVEATLREIAATKTIGGRRIVIERIPSAAAMVPCQILYIPPEVGPQDQRLAVESLGNAHVLIVGDSPGFAQRGAVVNFFVQANRIRFEINVDAARDRNLAISAKLLSLAKVIGASSAASQ